jgi:hypothetical protein
MSVPWRGFRTRRGDAFIIIFDVKRLMEAEVRAYAQDDGTRSAA